jgi:hypothetical protein
MKKGRNTDQALQKGAWPCRRVGEKMKEQALQKGAWPCRRAGAGESGVEEEAAAADGEETH